MNIGFCSASATSQLLTLKKITKLLYVYFLISEVNRFHLEGSFSLSQCMCPTKQDQISQKLREEQSSKMASPRLMGNPQEFLTSPHIRPSSNAGNLVHYLQQTQWNHFLNETPLRFQMLSQRLSFQALPQLPHSSRILPLPQSGIKSSNLISSMHFPSTQVCEEPLVILKSMWEEICHSKPAHQYAKANETEWILLFQ